MGKKKWGKIGAPKSEKRKTWLACQRKKISRGSTTKKRKSRKKTSRARSTTTNIKGYAY